MAVLLDVSRIKMVQPTVSHKAIDPSLIQQSKEIIPNYTLRDHASEPIKKPEDIRKLSDYFISNGRYRDNMLFICGINFGLRVSDLLELRFAHLINDDLSFKRVIPIYEIKTRNTRKRKKNRYISVNSAAQNAILLYLQNTPDVSMSDFLFRSESHNGKYLNMPIHRNSVETILKNAAKECGLTMHVATHTLRKTFAYHQMAMSNNDPRKLLLLQKMFGHASMAQTLDYIGITKDEIDESYMNFNLGPTYEMGEIIEEEPADETSVG